MNDKNFSILTLIDWVLKHWYNPYSLIISLPFVFWGGYKGVDFIFRETTIAFINNYFWEIKVGSGFLFSFICLLSWIFSRRYPRIKKNKIGILLAIRSNCPEARKVRDDVLDKFNTTMGDLPIRDSIDLLPLKDFQAKKVVDTKSALIVSNNCRAHFVVWGKSLSYRFDSQTHQYKFDLSFLVRHRAIKPKTKLIVHRGFQEALVDKTWRFLEKDILNGIKVTVNNIREVALYIIGIASFLSFNFEISKNFHLSLYNLLRQDTEKRKALSPMRERLPLFISDSLNMLGFISYKRDKDVKLALSLTERALKFLPRHYGALLSKARYLVELDNIKEAKKIIEIIKRMNRRGIRLPNSAWRYSDAFLLFFDEDFKKGIKAYKKAFDGYITELTLESVINFTENSVAKNPNKIQFLYALGIIYLKKKGNLPKALDNFEKFLKQARKDIKFKPLAIRAKNYIHKICKEMNIKEKGI